MIKRRNMFVQVLLMIVTFGFYMVYWFYQTAKEMKGVGKDESASPALWTVLLFIPIAGLYAMYKHAELFERISSDKLTKWIVLILWIFFSPAVWFIVQSDLNSKAGVVSSTPTPVAS